MTTQPEIAPAPNADLPAAPRKTARVLVFIVAYNAETTLASVLKRIPQELREHELDVLVIDDSSQDKTFEVGVRYDRTESQFDFPIIMMRNPVNQGYGGNQKLGYHYAIEHGYDFVVLLHGDGQYAPEAMPKLLEPLLAGEADAVFGSRMMEKGGARKGGMPFYKWVGNRILTTYQNRVLGSTFTEFHSGYRIYRVAALAKIPFERCSNNFHFDTQIIIQLLIKGLRIKEVAIPTYYGDEICRVDGLKYAWNVFRTTLRSRLHQMNLLYDRKYDVGPPEEKYDLKLGYPSSHEMAISAVKPGSRVLDLGCGQGYVAQKLAERGCRVIGLDQYVPAGSRSARELSVEETGGGEKGSYELLRHDLNSNELPFNVSQFDQVFLLDIIEHLSDPEVFMEELRFATGLKRPEVVLTTGNIAFGMTRAMLAIGQFNYGRKGILDRTHTRLFTFKTLVQLLDECGYDVLEVRGIPAPFPAAIGLNGTSKFMLSVNQFLIRISKGLFAYQIFVRATARPSVKSLLEHTITSSEEKRKAL